jgi:hypothetical protein
VRTFANRTPNGYDYYLQFIQGRKEVGRRDISEATVQRVQVFPYPVRQHYDFQTVLRVLRKSSCLVALRFRSILVNQVKK